jgi:hypothetical protein
MNFANYLETCNYQLHFVGFFIIRDKVTNDLLLPLHYVADFEDLLNLPCHRMLPLSNEKVFWKNPREIASTELQAMLKAAFPYSMSTHHVVPLPVVYNIMVTSEQLRTSAIFLTIHRVLKMSSYWPMLELVPKNTDEMKNAANTLFGGQQVVNKMLTGPLNIYLTAQKYMFTSSDISETEQDALDALLLLAMQHTTTTKIKRISEFAEFAFPEPPPLPTSPQFLRKASC